jgi:hypothetical protein
MEKVFGLRHSDDFPHFLLHFVKIDLFLNEVGSLLTIMSSTNSHLFTIFLLAI